MCSNVFKSLVLVGPALDILGKVPTIGLVYAKTK